MFIFHSNKSNTILWSSLKKNHMSLNIIKNLKGYEGVEPYIYDLQSKCITLCTYPLKKK